MNSRTNVKILNLILKLPQQHNERNVHYIFSGNMDLCKLLKYNLLVFLFKLYKLKKSSGSVFQDTDFLSPFD